MKKILFAAALMTFAVSYTTASFAATSTKSEIKDDKDKKSKKKSCCASKTAEGKTCTSKSTTETKSCCSSHKK